MTLTLNLVTSSSHASSFQHKPKVQVWEQSIQRFCPKTDFLFIVTVILTFNFVISFVIPCTLFPPPIHGQSLGTIRSTTSLNMPGNQFSIYSNSDLDLQPSDLICNPMRALVTNNLWSKFGNNWVNG